MAENRRWYPGRLLNQVRKQEDDKEVKLRVKFVTLHDVTRQQDLINLEIRSIINDDKDPRWLPIHMVDDANAIILEISQAEGHRELMNMAYITEKIDGLNQKLFTLKMKG